MMPQLGGTGLPLPRAAPVSVRPSRVLLAVVGAHLSGQPLNWLTDRKATFVRTARTAFGYSLYARSGIVTLDDGGTVNCFLCETDAVTGSEDITVFGGWRNRLNQNARDAGVPQCLFPHHGGCIC